MSEEIPDEAIAEAVSTGYARLPNGNLLMGMPLAAPAEDGPYAGLSPYGIAVTALERILELNAGTWDEASAIASEAHALAVAEASAEGNAEACATCGAEPQPAPELAAAMAETRKMRDVVCKLLDLYGAPDDRFMQHSSVTRATLQRYAAEAGVHLDRLPK